MFCPNCGTQNESAATPCKKCGFKLSGISVPKFKGTMMLNSDQTVQQLIDEHRRKQAEGGPAENRGRSSEPPPPRPPSIPPPSVPPGQRGAVLQPPRAAGAVPRRRMGGTMLGVAPQGGAVAPPVPPLARSVEPTREEAPAEAEAQVADTTGADPYAATSAVPISEPPPEEAPAPAPPARALNVTVPIAAVPAAPEPRAAAPGDGRWADPGSDDTDQDEDASNVRNLEPPEPARARPLAPTAALPQQPDQVAARADLDVDRSSVPPRLRPLDIVLLVCTLGLYGLVLWAKRRKPTAA